MKGKKYIRICENAGLWTYPGGNGSHTIIEVPPNYNNKDKAPDCGRGRKMVIPNDELAKGTERHIIKWLMQLSIKVAILLFVLFVLYSLYFYSTSGMTL